MAPIEKIISGVGMACSLLGIGMVLFFYLMAASFIEQMHSLSVSQIDSTIGVLEGSMDVISSTEGSVQSLAASIANASAGVGSAAGAIGGMGDAVDGMANGLAAIPLMPYDAVYPLYSTADGLRGTGEYLEESAAGLEESAGEMGSSALGLGEVKSQITSSIRDLESTKGGIGIMRAAAQGATLFGCLLVSLIFITNLMSFYLQFRR